MKRIFALIFIVSSINFAQSAGNAGFSFLKNGFGARNIAMGDLGVAGSYDLTAAIYNPAVLAKFSKSQIMVSHSEWLVDLRTELFGASFSLWGVPLAIGINTTTVSDIEVRTGAGELESTFSAHYFYGSLSTGFKIIDNISFGATYKYLYEGILTDEATGYGIDLGLHYSGLIEGLNIGASIRNLGSMNELRDEATKLPADLRIGASYKFKLEEIVSDIIVLGGFQKYTPTDDSHLHAGAEIFYDELIALRFGYVTGWDSKNFSAGLGLNWNTIDFDYAFTPFSQNLGSAHTVSVMYSF